MTKKRHILATAGLPYANGSIHLGHLVEYILVDIWCRFQRLSGHDCYYICGDDTHGTPIMLAAQKQRITPEELIALTYEAHYRDLSDFGVQFDCYYSTHSKENKILVEEIYHRLISRKDITKAVIEQPYDAEKKMFLPDRYIKGECPRCHAKDQYSDSCEQCGAAYEYKALIHPLSVLSHTPPISKASEHYFFELSHYEDTLKNWLDKSQLQTSVKNKLQEWFVAGLKRWDISRDAPYFGFNIPGTKDKYFYVWLDAPIGYMAAFRHYCDQHPGISFDDFWKNTDQTTELYHFIGKDIMYFHTLFWPAILSGAGFRLPTGVFVHGFLTVNGKKMSKSRGTFITARQYLKYLPAEYLRYYFAGKLTPHIEDIDLNFHDFILRVNSDLVGKFINLASRCAKFITQYFDGKLSDCLHDASLFAHFVSQGDLIAQCYESLNYNQAMRLIMELADKANYYIDAQKPWLLVKESNQALLVQAVCTQSLNLFKILASYLKPVLPETTKKIEYFLNIAPMDWKNSKKPLLNQTIRRFQPLMHRVKTEQIDALMGS
jgi:methionyl-tRNA synthetase